MEQRPPVLKKRRVGKPSLDDQCTQVLCDWVATLEALPEDLPQAKRRVLLWDCASVHRMAFLLQWVRAARPDCHVLFVPCGYTAELQSADISIQHPLKHIIKQQAVQFFAESVCQDEAVLDLRLATMKRLMAHWVLHACAEVEKHEHHNESLAPPLLDIRRGTKACGESRSRAPQWHFLR